MMQLDVKFEELNRTLDVNFGEIQVVDNYDVGFAEGFKQGKTKGYSEGYSKGETDGIETGKQEMHIAFWNGITANGTRAAFEGGFRDWMLTPELFRPNSTIKAGGNSRYLFYYTNATTPIDMVALEEELGYPIIDTTGATNLSYAFSNCKAFSKLGVINVSSCTTTNACWYMFYQPSYQANRTKSIKKLVVSKDTDLAGAFNQATGIEHCLFEGTIAKNGLNMQHCTKLDKESHESIINCLSTETSGLSVTVSKTAVNKAFETSSGANNGSTSAEWTTLVTSRNNWTINLA